MNRDRLIKLLNMTTSENDGEALNAIRLANKELEKEKTTWKAVLGRTITTTTVRTHAAAPQRFSGPRIDKVFSEVLYSNPRLGTEGKAQVLRMRQMYWDRGYLTLIEYADLMQFVRKVRQV
jgi:hypothetical protein